MDMSKTRVAMISIIVDANTNTDALNGLLSEAGEYIIGRMGIPYPARQVSLISVAIDAPSDAISALTGKLGRLGGVTVKTAYSKL